MKQGTNGNKGSRPGSWPVPLLENTLSLETHRQQDTLWVMKTYSKLIMATTGLATIARALMAAEAARTYSTPSTNAYSTPNYSTSISIGTFSSNAELVAMNAQASLWKEMIEEHQKRAADLSQKGQTEKANWETELVNELQEKSGRLRKSIDEISQPGSATNDLKGAGSTLDEQLLFVSAVEARLQQIQQELSVATGQTGALAMQVASKTTAEEIAAISSALEDNHRLVKELQREQLDLELRKLEFRAIQKALRK